MSSSRLIGASNFVTSIKFISLVSGMIKSLSSNTELLPPDESVIAEMFKASDVDGSIDLPDSAVLFSELDVDASGSSSSFALALS